VYFQHDDIGDIVRAHRERRKNDKPTNGFRRFPEISLDDLTFKVRQHFEAVGLITEYKNEIASLSANVIQSPIERAMISFLRFENYAEALMFEDIKIYLPGDDIRITEEKDVSIALLPQHNVRGYYLDIGMHIRCYDHLLRIDVECDGVEFHYATKDQFDHDRQRDIVLTAEGYVVWRSHGTNINRNPLHEAQMLTEAIGSWIKDVHP